MTERAFVIHVSPYLEHGALVTLLGEAGGRMTAVSRKGGMSYPEFTECEAVLREGRSMPALRELEPSEPFSELRGTRLVCGMYMNELVFRLTDDREPCDGLFYAYAEALSVIRRGGASDVAPALRGFESELLGSTGYGVDFLSDSDGDPVEEGRRYRFSPDAGFTVSASGQGFSGGDLIAAAEGDFSSKSALRAAREVFRAAIDARLGGHQLVSRNLYARFLAGRKK